MTTALALGLVLASLVLAPPVVAQRPLVYQVPVTGVIELGLAPFVKRSIREAERAGARAVILRINTLGGRVDAALQIVDAVSAAKVPIYAFIEPRAISAGALISMAADSVFMTPDALFGASTVVGSAGEKMSEKSQSVMRAQYRALAERRGIDPKIGEAMVDEDIEIAGVVARGKLLTLTAHEAARVGYAIEVRDLDTLLVQTGLTGAMMRTTAPNWAESVVRFLTHPIVAALLLPIGVLGILTELKTPSFGLAGVAGVAALVLFFGSHVIVGLAGREELLMLAAGIVLVALEIFVIPGFGAAGVLGVASIGVAIFMALLGEFSTKQDVVRALGIVSAAFLMTIVAVGLLVRALPQRMRTFGVALQTTTARDEGFVSGKARQDLISMEGVTLTDLRPAGTALIGSERIDVVSDAGFVAKDRRVRVVRAEPYRTVVLPIEDVSAAGTG
jgi:membrane-bound serine protease (ClpP class)